MKKFDLILEITVEKVRALFNKKIIIVHLFKREYSKKYIVIIYPCNNKYDLVFLKDEEGVSQRGELQFEQMEIVIQGFMDECVKEENKCLKDITTNQPFKDK